MASMIHEAGYFQEVPRRKLQYWVWRWRDHEITPTTMKRTLQALRDKDVYRFARRLDSISEIENLISLQKARVQKALTLEGKTDFLMAQAGQEIRLLGDLLERVTKLYIDVGLMPSSRSNRPDNNLQKGLLDMVAQSPVVRPPFLQKALGYAHGPIDVSSSKV